jgi:hypothetical protein
VESQSKPDPRCAFRWPYYAAFLHSKYECAVVMVVVTASRRTAEWARQPWDSGPPGISCVTLRKIVFGPGNMPLITDPTAAGEDPVFAVLAALTHRRSRRIHAILEALAAALTRLDTDTANAYSAFIEAGLGKNTSATQIWRTLMASERFPYATALEVKSKAEGKAEGKAEAIIEVLDGRGISLGADDRKRILACTDISTLGEWLRRALRVSTSRELFA